MRVTYQFTAGWKFHRGDLAETNHRAIHANRFKRAEWMKAGNHGISRPGYPDEDWKDVDLPHDFVVEGEFSPAANPVHGSLPADAGWYRKTFEIPPEARNKRIHLEFDGIYRDSTIWVNGHLAGSNLSGYTSFSLDVTELCNPDHCNVVAVRCDAREFELWSYEGGGIYRDVRLVATDCLHVPYSGICVRSTFPDDADLSRVHIDLSARIDNAGTVDADAEVTFRIYEDGETSPKHQATCAAFVAAGTCTKVVQGLYLSSPALWDTRTPRLYRLETHVRTSGESRDIQQTRFGLRSIRFDADKGFFLNGEGMKLQGVCNHQDHAGVGVATLPAIDEWRLRQLKAMGCNAIRTAHHPPSPHLLELCDQMGFLVINETRLAGTAPELLKQLESLVKRDRNHPSVCLWSLGNEEMLIQENASGPGILRRMQALAHRLDPTRPCIYSANCDFNAIAGNFRKHDFRIDVFGANYTMRTDSRGRPTAEAERYDEFKSRFPDWPLLASESGGSASTRGLYDQEYHDGKALRPDPETTGADAPVHTNPERAGMVTAYAEMLTPWGRTIEDTWEDCATRDFLGGTFLWAGFDYRGETYPFSWPAVIARYGIMDLCGFPKDSYYYYQAEWTKAPVLHLFPHWNLKGKEGQSIDLWCYTNCHEAELWLNGRSRGRLKRAPFRKLQWEIPYDPGELRAAGYDAGGNEVAHALIRTTGPARGLRIIVAHSKAGSDGATVAILNVNACDAAGHCVPDADATVDFEIRGPAYLLGTGNGNPTSHEPEQAPRRQLFNGHAQLIIRTLGQSGTVSILARAENLEPALFEIEVSGSKPGSLSIGASTAENPAPANPNPVDGSV